MPYGPADARQHSVVAVLQDFFSHRPIVWLNGPPVPTMKPAARSQEFAPTDLPRDQRW